MAEGEFEGVPSLASAGSTVDEELAVCQAHDLYRSAPCFYDLEAIHQKAVFNLSKLESRLEKVRASGDAAKIQDLETRVSLARLSEQSAREALPRLAAFHEPDPA